MDSACAAGGSDEQARAVSVPYYLEVEPDLFKPIAECSAQEIRAAADSMMRQAKATMDQAERLYAIADAEAC